MTADELTSERASHDPREILGSPNDRLVAFAHPRVVRSAMSFIAATVWPTAFTLSSV